jgi:hypothetical protein
VVGEDYPDYTPLDPRINDGMKLPFRQVDMRVWEKAWGDTHRMLIVTGYWTKKEVTKYLCVLALLPEYCTDIVAYSDNLHMLNNAKTKATRDTYQKQKLTIQNCSSKNENWSPGTIPKPQFY